MESIDIVIKESLLPRLAQLAGPGVNNLSPWARDYGKLPARSDETHTKIENQLYFEDGQLRKDIADIVTLLKKPVKYVRLRLRSGPLILDHIVYSCLNGAYAQPVQVSLTYGDEQLALRSPAPLELIMVGILEYWGDSSLTSSAFRFKLKRSETLVLAAIIDLHRRAILADRSAMRIANPGYYNTDHIAIALRETPPDNQWLVAAFSAYMQWDTNLSGEQVEKSLADLAGLQLVTARDKGYCLIQDALTFANHFLLIGQALQMEAGMEAADGKVTLSKMLCLQGGLHENLYLEAGGDYLVGEAVSGHFIADLIDRFLTGNFDLREEPLQSGEQLANDIDQADKAEKERVYFIGRGEQSYGPYSWEEMLDFAAKGNLVRDDHVWKDNQKKWVKASQLRNLFN